MEHPASPPLVEPESPPRAPGVHGSQPLTDAPQTRRSLDFGSSVGLGNGARVTQTPCAPWRSIAHSD
jgi:hypothetical protein